MSFAGTRIRVVHDSDDGTGRHDQLIHLGELRGILEYGIDEHWTVEAQIPLRLVQTGIVYRLPDGIPFDPPNAGVHHRDEALFGLADVAMMVHRRFGPFTGGVGVSLPFGSTEKNPFRLGDLGLEHQHVQLGTGTFDPLLHLRLTFGPLSLYGRAQIVLYENGQGHRAGDRYEAGLSAAAKLFGPFGGSLRADVVHERPERWDGEVLQDGNLGRTDLFAGGAISIALGDYDLALGLRLAVYRQVIQNEVEPGELTSPGVIDVTLARNF